MLYAILAYHEEHVVQSWSDEEDAALMEGLLQVHDRLEGKLGPSARLGGTAAAVTIRGKALVIDGPFAETKEQLLGFYVIEADTLRDAVVAALDLKAANPSAVYEVRPIVLYQPGKPFPVTDAGLDTVRPPRD